MSKYKMNDIQDLIDSLDSINTITGVESIIDRCHKAAECIRLMENFRREFIDNARSTYKSTADEINKIIAM